MGKGEERMTIQEIIESIDYCLECDNDRIPTTQEDLRTIKEALEKQIPKKLIVDSEICHYVDCQYFFCPYCRNHIITRLDGDLIAGRKQKCCDKCGQALDWSDIK